MARSLNLGLHQGGGWHEVIIVDFTIVLLVQNTTNCILAQRSSLGLAGRRPALA